jgi:predicted ferric reductase
MDQTLWYASRATGLVALLLLTATVVLGVTTAGRFATSRWPRFVIAAVHRNLSLLSVSFLGVHIATAVIDPYAGMSWADAVIPFGSAYRPVWVGLGAVALDLLIAVVATSLLRLRIPLRWWRAVHWSSYVLFPLAVVHGLGAGGTGSGLGWILAIDAACVLAVALALGWRMRVTHPDTESRRAAELARAVNP